MQAVIAAENGFEIWPNAFAERLTYNSSLDSVKCDFFAILWPFKI